MEEIKRERWYLGVEKHEAHHGVAFVDAHAVAGEDDALNVEAKRIDTEQRTRGD